MASYFCGVLELQIWGASTDFCHPIGNRYTYTSKDDKFARRDQGREDDEGHVHTVDITYRSLIQRQPHPQ